jgi:acetyltransferase-like isoleucine patch superfamily enzyme
MVQRNFKIKEMKAGKLGRWQQYAEWVVGKADLVSVLKYELITFFLGNLSGAMGLYLRSKFYPLLFKSVGSSVFFGKGITLRHPHKIRIGDNVMIDDYCMLDAKGQTNKGIVIEDGVFIGRGSILCCKDGDIEVQNGASVSYNCELFSSRYLCIGKRSMIAAYCYLMSGGSYDYQHSEVSFSDQDGYAKGPTVIGEGCWLGTKVVVLDGVSIGDRAVVGAGSVVTKSLPSRAVAVGIPAKVSDVLAKAD